MNYKNTEYRKLTASDISILTSVKSPAITGGDNEIEALLDYLFVTSHGIKELIKAKKSWQESVLIWGSQFSTDDLTQLGELMTNDLTEISESQVETDEGEGKI